jgi:hypothetical protein
MKTIVGEFGVVYKAQLNNWQGSVLPKAVAVKTAKGGLHNSIIYTVRVHNNSLINCPML